MKSRFTDDKNYKSNLQNWTLQGLNPVDKWSNCELVLQFRIKYKNWYCDLGKSEKKMRSENAKFDNSFGRSKWTEVETVTGRLESENGSEERKSYLFLCWDFRIFCSSDLKQKRRVRWRIRKGHRSNEPKILAKREIKLFYFIFGYTILFILFKKRFNFYVI